MSKKYYIFFASVIVILGCLYVINQYRYSPTLLGIDQKNNLKGLCSLLKNEDIKGVVFNVLYANNQTTFVYMDKSCNTTTLGSADLGYNRDDWFNRKHNHIESVLMTSDATATVSNTERKLIFHSLDNRILKFDLPQEVLNSLPSGIEAYENAVAAQPGYAHSISPDSNYYILPRKATPGVSLIFDLYKKSNPPFLVKESVVPNQPKFGINNLAWSTDSKKIVALYSGYNPGHYLQVELIDTNSFENKKLFSFNPNYEPGSYDYFVVWSQLKDGTILIQSGGRGVQALSYDGESITSRKQITDNHIKLIKLIY